MEARTQNPAHGAAEQASPPAPDRRIGRERGWLVAVTTLAIVLLLALSAGLLWVQREATLDLAKAQSLREVKRLAAELEQSLRLAQAIMDSERDATGPGTAGTAVPGVLVQALSLPFDLRRLPPEATAVAGQPTGQWLPGLAVQDQGRWHLPMRWRQPPDRGGQLYELRLSRDALLARFASEGLPAKGSMSLFRIEDQGATTVLARHPLVEREQGLTVFGHVATAVARQPVGVMQVTAVIDGVERIVGHQQLARGGQRLVVVYALPVSQVLAPWRSTLPLVVALTLLLAAVMGYGAWRMGRSVRALARSERHFQTLSAHLPDVVVRYDRAGRVLYANPAAEAASGVKVEAMLGRSFEQFGTPPDVTRQWMACLQRVFETGIPEILYFSHRSPQGVRHWEAQVSREPVAIGEAPTVLVINRNITERKALEEAQRQTLKHLDTVANASASLAWTVDAQQQTDWLNQPWLDFTGRDLRSECETFWLDDLHPQDRERCAQVFNSAFEAREPYSMEYRLRRHDGEYRWLHEQGRPRHDADHRFIGYIGSCLDVTELRQAEAVALERGAILEQVFDVIKDMLFLVDGQERFVFYKAASDDRLYRQPGEFLGKTMGDVMPPGLVDQMRGLMAQARQAGPQELNYSLDLPDGAHHFNARLAWLPGGEQCMFLVRDTTEQQNSRKDRERLSEFVLLLLRLATRFINLPVQQMDQAIDAALGDVGGFVRADRAYLFAYDMQAQTASNTHEWCAPGVTAQKDQLQDIALHRLPDWLQAQQQGLQINIPDVQALPPGDLRDFLEPQGILSLLAQPMMDGNTCLGFVGLDSVQAKSNFGDEELKLLELFAQMLVNMQLRSQMAAQVHEMTGQLEHKVEERTQQLHESVQRLQTVNRELESFTYSASHDLRTPLRGIEGFSSLLLEEHAAQLDQQGREYLRRIQRATLHMSQLVNDLLAYSRLQQLTGHIEPVDLAATVRAVAVPFRDELEARQGRLSVQIADDLKVQANPQGLAIVLRNLIDNALKFTPANTAPQIRIEAQALGDRVHLSVADQGIGFDMKYHDRIFGMFQRLHRQDQIPGTGIGLALVHKAVERMGGRVRAESAPGQGARFEIDLPGV